MTPVERQPPAVSVIVPVYNRRDVVCRAVRSLLAQDLAASYEIVVVDDGSTDGTADVVAALGDSRVRIVRQPNQGAAAARYQGIVHARAPVVAFLDSDDIALPTHLSALWAGLHRRGDVVLAYALAADLEDAPIHNCPAPANLAADGILADPLESLLSLGCFPVSMNVMTYRDLALAAGKGRARFVAANDYDFCLRIAVRGPFAFVDRTTIQCERRDDGISKRKGAMQVAFAVLAADQAVTLSGRRETALLAALRHRVEAIWPWAFAQLVAQRQWRLSRAVGAVGLRRARWCWSMRRLWWALNYVRTNSV